MSRWFVTAVTAALLLGPWACSSKSDEGGPDAESKDAPVGNDANDAPFMDFDTGNPHDGGAPQDANHPVDGAMRDDVIVFLDTGPGDSTPPYDSGTPCLPYDGGGYYYDSGSYFDGDYPDGYFNYPDSSSYYGYDSGYYGYDGGYYDYDGSYYGYDGSYYYDGGYYSDGGYYIDAVPPPFDAPYYGDGGYYLEGGPCYPYGD